MNYRVRNKRTGTLLPDVYGLRKAQALAVTMNSINQTDVFQAWKEVSA